MKRIVDARSHSPGVGLVAPGQFRDGGELEPELDRTQQECTAVWPTPEERGSATFEWIEAWYKLRRRHTSLEMLSPVDYEHLWMTLPALHTAAEGAA